METTMTRMSVQQRGVVARPHTHKQLVGRMARAQRMIARAATTLEAPPAQGELKTADPKQAELSIK